MGKRYDTAAGADMQTTCLVRCQFKNKRRKVGFGYLRSLSKHGLHGLCATGACLMHVMYLFVYKINIC